MRVIFLDFDGVINKLSKKDPRSVHPDCIAALAGIVKATQAEIVASAAAREPGSRMRTLVEEALAPSGIRILGETPRVARPPFLSGLQRPLEIASWLETNRDDVENFIAPDDEDNWALYPHNFRTRASTGLTQKVADAAIRFLRWSLKEVTLRQQEVNTEFHWGTRQRPRILWNGPPVPVQMIRDH